jgi:hypothetical protein
MSRPRKRTGAYTLVELIVYMALVTGALAVMVGLEMAASRASFLERALVDLALRGDDLGARFRDDIRQAVRIVTPAARPGTILIVGLPSGAEVRYELELPDKGKLKTERLVRTLHARPGAEPLERTAYEGLERFAFGHDARGARTEYVLEATFVYARGGEVSARRSFRYAASPIAEGSP